MGTDLQLYIVPMQLTIKGRTYLDGRDLSPTEFYRMQKGMKEVPSTSSPSPASFLDAFRAAAEVASSVLCLTVSPRFSSSFDSASNAAHSAQEALPDTRIVVVDTESAAGGQGLIAMEAWRAARGGAELDDVVSTVQAVVLAVSLLAFLDTLYYVWKSGRVPRVSYTATALLRIKPILQLSRGEIRNVARPRTRPRAVERMLGLMRQQVGPGPIHATVMHADAGEEAERLRLRVESEFPCQELFISEFSPVMGSHTGPGLLGIAFWSETPVPKD
jgi:DegV family protein with EDD domain